MCFFYTFSLAVMMEATETAQLRCEVVQEPMVFLWLFLASCTRSNKFAYFERNLAL